MTANDLHKEERDKIVKGLEEAYRRLIIHKRQINRPMVVLRDGKITEVDPHDMPTTTVYKRQEETSGRSEA
jgi:hypothetical protein